MFETNSDNLLTHLRDEMELEPNALVWLHSGVMGLGLLKGGLETVTNVFDKVLSDGALIIPTFSYSWCNGENYDPLATECRNMGVYAKDAWKDQRFKRNNNPNFSVSVMDNTVNHEVRNALLSDGVQETCFGKNSSFHNLYLLSKDRPGYIMLLGGAHNDVVFRTTFLHMVEEDIGVPYRYIKKFKDVNFPDNYVEQYVRYCSGDEYFEVNKKPPPTHYKFPIIAKYNQLGIDLKKESLIKIVKFGYSETRMVSIYPFCTWLKEKLKNDPEYLIN